MNPTDDLKRLIKVAGDLNPRAVAAEVAYLQAGPRSAPLGQIGHSAEQRLPLPDKLSKKVDRQHNEYRQAIAKAARLLDEAAFHQRDLLIRLDPDTARELAAGTSSSCDHCGVLGEKLTKGLCHTCYEYARRHGHDRPRELIEREVYG